VHDFEPFRVNKTNPTEFTLADNADLIVSHSNKMTQAFVNRGIQTPTVVQPLFDYLGPNPPLANYSQQINFAGTFQKSPWLHDYQGPALTLFGARPKKWQEWVVPPTINWQGNLDPDEITAVFKTGFGLIWDSDFDDKSYQSYTKLNAPHKASLYLKAGLPLIAWDQSHIGRLIQAHNLGFTISSLADLDSILSQVTVDQYQDWQKNLVPWRDKVATGG
ncbi:beta-1,6-galactofuranosyltransferase, partial [Fructobacillus ficulneus]|uniref:beta-1,6-galactofuranosyltransferase n=1 Tax=Fructobacillus ficulneus TaxID=157463 RepID=UPI0007821CBB